MNVWIVFCTMNRWIVIGWIILIQLHFLFLNLYVCIYEYIDKSVFFMYSILVGLYILNKSICM